QQRDDVRAGIAELATDTETVFGGTGEVTPVGVPAGKGFFVGPVLRTTDRMHLSVAMHAREVFGPVATIGPYAGEAGFAPRFVARGDGCLVSSAYSDDRDWVAEFVAGAARWAGRLY